MAFWWSAPVKPRNHPFSQLHLAQRTWQARLTSQLIGLIPQQSNLLPWHEAVNDKEQWQGDQLSLSFPGLFCALRKLKIWSVWSHRVSYLVGGVGHQKPEVLFPFAVPRPSTPYSLLMNDDLPLDFISSGKRTLRHLQKATALLRGFSFMAQWN